MTQHDAAAQRPKGLAFILTITRAFAYPASLSAVLLGQSIAIYQGNIIMWDRFLASLVGVLLFHTAANLLNDSHDFNRGLDSMVLPISGGVVRGWITPVKARNIAFVCLALGIVIGLRLFMIAGWPVLALGIIGFFIALGYTGKKYCLKYAALGDIAIFLAFGFLPVFGSYFVQAGHFDWTPVIWTLPMVSLTVGILHANNWRDIDTDSKKGCRTMAGILGDRRSADYYALLMLGPFILILTFILAGSLILPAMAAPLTVLVTLPVFIRARQLVKIGKARSEGFIMLDGLTAQMQLLFGILLAMGFILGRWIG
ncbi:1,4-dihydroxy-2-naphthoate octaprenyltransferase [bacterium]|nr:1,4-dihydroxy-2-naphthoate octaprenyltransferase [bacterium]